MTYVKNELVLKYLEELRITKQNIVEHAAPQEGYSPAYWDFVMGNYLTLIGNELLCDIDSLYRRIEELETKLKEKANAV